MPHCLHQKESEVTLHICVLYLTYSFNKQQQSKKRLKCTCFRYGGHTIEFCSKRIRDENREAARMAREKQQVPQGQSPSFSQDGYAFPAFAYRSIHNKTDWFADFGATQHMTDQRHPFGSFVPVTTGNRPVIGIGTDNASLNVQGHGTINNRSKVDGAWHDGTHQSDFLQCVCPHPSSLSQKA